MKRTQGQLDTKAAKRKAAVTGWHELPWRGMTPEQTDQWIEANVRDLASSKQVLKLLARAVVYLARFDELE